MNNMHNMNKKINRRTFLKLQAKNGLFLAASASGLFLPKLSFASTVPDIGVAKGKTVAATRAAVELIGGIKSVVKKGHKVLIKPNMSFERSPEAATNTHPDVVKTVAAMCKEAGAARVMILDHTLASGKSCIQTSGIGPACEAIDKTWCMPSMIHLFSGM